MKKYNIPNNVKPYIIERLQFDDLIPFENKDNEQDDIDHENNQKILDEVLQNISNVINKKPIYRALKINDIPHYLKENLPKETEYGNHWTNELISADINWNADEHSEKYQNEKEQKNILKNGVVILQGKIKDPHCINIPATIDLYFQFGDTENEININGNHSCIEITKIGNGRTTKEAQMDLLK